VSQVNLLPPEIKERQKIRQRTAVVAAIGGAVLLLIIGFYFLQQMNLSREQDDLAAQEQTNSSLQTQISSLQRFGDIQAELQQKRGLEDKVFANEVSWSGVLVDVSRVIPSDAFLTTMAAQITAGAEAAPGTTTTTPAALVGQISFAGTSDGLDSLTVWLSRLGQVRGWVNPYATSAAETQNRSRKYDFQSSADLSRDALTKRGSGQGATP
jgi:type IV pilus assembly protein PilN